MPPPMASAWRQGDTTIYNPQEIFNNLQANWKIPRKDLWVKALISSGDAGAVHLAEMNGINVAAKIMKTKQKFKTIQEAKADQAYKDMCLELAALSALKHHPNVVSFLGACVEDPLEPILIQELVDGEDLAKFWARASGACTAWKPPRHTAYGWILHLYSGLSHLHSSNPMIIHRDIKPANLLLANNLSVLKIADFGTAKRVNAGEKETAMHSGRTSGNVMYMAPEVYSMESGHYDEKCDIYSAALISWRIATGKFFPPRTQWPDELWRPSLDVLSWPELGAIIDTAWEQVPQERPSAAQVVQMLNNLPNKPDIQTLGIAPPPPSGCCVLQ